MFSIDTVFFSNRLNPQDVEAMDIEGCLYFTTLHSREHIPFTLLESSCGLLHSRPETVSTCPLTPLPPVPPYPRAVHSVLGSWEQVKDAGRIGYQDRVS